MRKMDDFAQASQLLYLLILMVIMMFIFGDQNVSSIIVNSINVVFYPLIGFDGNFPVLTLILGGIIVVFLSSFFHTIFTDWKKMGEMQETSRAFQKELSTARKAGNTNRVNKLMKMQPQIMKKQTEAQGGMMKSMIFLFIFIVPIFMWLRYFLGILDYSYFTLPWANGVPLVTPPEQKILMQAWLWIYLMFSMVVGQVIRQSLKWISWSDWWINFRKKIIPSAR